MAKTTKTVKVEDTLKEVSQELLSLMGLEKNIEITKDEEDGEVMVVNVPAEEEAGLLIGRHGETIHSIQLVLGMIMQKRTGEWKHVVVNVGDWREKQEQKLRELADQTAERVRSTGEPQPLYNLTPSQRRVIHLALSQQADVITESVGEGRERYLLVKPRSS